MSDINVQTFSGKVNISNNLKVGQGHLFVDTLNNQVGLNTNTPAASLHVNGNTFVNTDLRVGTKVLIDSGATDSNVIEVTNGNIKAEFLHGDGSNITSISADNIDGTLSQWTGAVGSSIYYAENVGIGLTNPQFKLDVNGDANVGVLTATFLHGDGSNITNIVSSQWEGDPGNPIYYDGNVGIATSSAPTRTLEVGSNLYVEDAGSNVLVVDGNVAVDSISVGDFTIVASQGLDHVTNENNTTTQVVQFNHPTTGFITAANAVIGGTLSLQNFALSQSYGLENVTDVNNTTGDTIVSSNATTGFQSTANVSVGRDALVTGNVTVGKDLTVTEEATFSSNVTIAKDLEVSGNVTNLDVLSNVNLLSVSNVVSIKKDSNVVTEFPRSKKLIRYPRVALTSAAQTVSGYEGYFTSQDSSTLNNLSSRQAWGFFDSVTNPNDASGGPHILNATDRFDSSGNYIGGDTFAGISGDWITIQLPVKIQLSRVHTWSRYGHQRNPVDATILGSLDGTNWTTIASWNGRDFTYNHPNPYDIQTNEYYNYFAFVFEKIESSSSGKYINFNEIELYGVPEYDPEADGTDVTIKSLPNVPNTDWLEVYYDAKESSSYPGTGGTVVDLSGNGKNGTLNGDVGFDSEYKAFTFDEANDYITLDTGKTGNYIFSVSLWFKSSGNSIETLFHMNGDYATNNTVWIYGDGTSLSIGFVNNDYSCDTGKEIADNMWHHASFVYNGNGESGRDIYLDGIHLGGSLSGSNAGDNLNLTSTSSISRIGALNHSSGIIHEFKGSIANFRLFNRALTQDEAWQLYSYQKEYFGHGDLSMTLKAGRLGIGTSEPRAALDVKGDIYGGCPVYFNVRCSTNAAAGIIPWNDITESKGGGFDTTTGTFITPLTGVYSFSYTIRERDNNASIYTRVVINGVENSTLGRIYLRSNYAQSAITFLRFMNQGDTLAIQLNNGDMSSNYNQFSGQYISSV